jgi:hypothetical protein
MTSIETKEILSGVPYYYLSMCMNNNNVFYCKNHSLDIIKKTLHGNQTLKEFDTYYNVVSNYTVDDSRKDLIDNFRSRRNNLEFKNMFFVSVDLLCVITTREVIVINVIAWKIQTVIELDHFEHFDGYLGMGVISERNVVKVVSLLDGKTLKTFAAHNDNSYITALTLDDRQIITATYESGLSQDAQNKIALKAWSLNGELEYEFNVDNRPKIGLLILRDDQILVANDRNDNIDFIDRDSGELLGSKKTYFKNTPKYTNTMLIVDHKYDKTIKIHGLYENEVVGQFHDNNWEIAAMSSAESTTKIIVLWKSQFMGRDYYNNVKQYKQKMSILDISEYKKKILETQMSTEDVIKKYWNNLRNPESNLNIVDLRKHVSKFKSNTTLSKKQRIMEKVLLEWDNKVNKTRENFLKEAKVGMGVNKLIDYAKANKDDIILKNVNNKEELAILEVFDWYWSFEENQSKSDNKKAKTNANFKHLPPIRIVRPNI